MLRVTPATRPRNKLHPSCLHTHHTAYFAGIFSPQNVENTAQAALGSANRRLSRNLRPFSGHFQEFLQVRHTVKVVRYGTGPWRCAAGYGPLPSINGHLELEHRLQITGIMQIDQIGSGTGHRVFDSGQPESSFLQGHFPVLQCGFERPVEIHLRTFSGTRHWPHILLCPLLAFHETWFCFATMSCQESNLGVSQQNH